MIHILGEKQMGAMSLPNLGKIVLHFKVGMDHKFSLHLHGRPRLIKIIDQTWVNEKLAQDDIQISEDKSIDLKNTKGIPLNTNDTLNDDDEVEEAFHNTEASWNETQSFDL